MPVKMLKLKSDLNATIDEIKHGPNAHKLLSIYVKPYDLGDVIYVVGFYVVKNNQKTNMTLEELSIAFKRRKVKCDEVKFDIRELKVREEYKYGDNKYGFVAFNGVTQPPSIAYNRYPNYDDGSIGKHSWKFISFAEYFKENPIVNLEYIDYKYATMYMSINAHIPKRISRTLSIIVNNYLGSRYV